MKRGTIKRFREFLNNKYVNCNMTGSGKGVWRAGSHNQYGNRTRKYGDWLYFQDRAMFDELLSRTLETPNRGETDFKV